MIKVCNLSEGELDDNITSFPLTADNEPPYSIILLSISMYLTDKVDEKLRLSDKDLISWKEREDYTGSYLPHYLNYFMIHLVDGYLNTGGY